MIIAKAGPKRAAAAKWTVNDSDMPLSWLVYTNQRSAKIATHRKIRTSDQRPVVPSEMLYSRSAAAAIQSAVM